MKTLIVYYSLEGNTEYVAEIRSRSEAGDSGEDSKAISVESELRNNSTDVPEISESVLEEITEEEGYEETDSDDETDSYDEES